MIHVRALTSACTRLPRQTMEIFFCVRAEAHYLSTMLGEQRATHHDAKNGSRRTFTKPLEALSLPDTLLASQAVFIQSEGSFVGNGIRETYTQLAAKAIRIRLGNTREKATVLAAAQNHMRLSRSGTNSVA